jgi:hypothetical protein
MARNRTDRTPLIIALPQYPTISLNRTRSILESLLLLALASLLLLASNQHLQAQPVHQCAANAIEQAEKLLKFHSENSKQATVDQRVKVVEPVSALSGKGQFDVLEVEGFVYKGTYRIHLIYAQISGSCLLMGQEILERDNPY